MSKYSDKFQKIKKKALINTGFPACYGWAIQGNVRKINDINLKQEGKNEQKRIITGFGVGAGGLCPGRGLGYRGRQLESLRLAE